MTATGRKHHLAQTVPDGRRLRPEAVVPLNGLSCVIPVINAARDESTILSWPLASTLSANVIVFILQRAEVSGTCCLRFIDPFGDTTFNRGQATVLLQELAGIRPKLEDRERALVDCIIRIAEQTERKVHLYLKFIGD